MLQHWWLDLDSSKWDLEPALGQEVASKTVSIAHAALEARGSAVQGTRKVIARMVQGIFREEKSSLDDIYLR